MLEATHHQTPFLLPKLGLPVLCALLSLLRDQCRDFTNPRSSAARQDVV